MATQHLEKKIATFALIHSLYSDNEKDRNLKSKYLIYVHQQSIGQKIISLIKVAFQLRRNFKLTDNELPRRNREIV